MKRFRNISMALCLAIISLTLVACGKNAVAYGTITRTPDLTGGSGLSYSYNETTHIASFGGASETVAYYPEDLSIGRSAGNRVGITITAPSEITSYEGFKLTIYEDTVYEGLNTNGIPNAFDGDNYMYIYPLVSDTQREVSIKIQWNSDVEEQMYKVVILEDTTFATA